ncbi:acetyl-CoA carboxylase biotin carboxyl carrier protein [Paraburkholderia lacunae]|nr:acetyl-CoA carboxylase biotin carboxyl carrier protein subunit [Paraburkholderia lacunae]
MNTSSIRRLVQMVTQSRIAELQVESEPMGRVIVRNAAPVVASPGNESLAPAARLAGPAAVPPHVTPRPLLAPRRIVASSLVGTYRHGAAENSAPLVRCGETIEAGQVMCVIEAMRLKHEIRSPHDGRLVEVLADEGEPVDFGRPLFIIEALDN